MSQSKDAETPYFQAFKSKDGKLLQSLPYRIRDADGSWCIFWQDIESAFNGVDHVEYLEMGIGNPVRSRFLVGQDGELLHPLRIWSFMGALQVIYREDQGPLPPAVEFQYLYRTLTEVFKILEENRTGFRKTFMEWAANVRHHHSKMMNQLTVLKESGVKVEFDGKTEDEVVEEAQRYLRMLGLWDYWNICRHVLASYMNFPAPYRFVVLPADLGSWDDSDPTTHTFLLYFLCDVNKDPDLTEWLALDDPTITTWITGNEFNDEFILPKIPDHKHFSNHPGYKLIRPHEFFKTYGCYTLMILRMVWHGFPDAHYDIPRLDTCKILWGHDLDGSVNRLTKDTIGPLVNKAINYIEGLSLPRRGSEMWLTEREAVAIKEFLDIPESCSALGKLYRYFDHTHWYWTCEQHAHRKHPPGTLEALVDFVHSCGGQVDTQLATLQVELYSRSQVDMLSTLLHNFKHRFHTITLHWKDSSWQGLEDCLQKVATAEVRGSDLRYLLRSPVTKQAHHVQLDGVSCDIHPQGTPEYKTDIFASLIQNDRDLQSLTLLNFPQPQEQCAYFGGGLAVYCMHSKRHQQEEPKHWTEDLLRKVIDYTEAILCNDRNGLAKASWRLRKILAEDGYQDVSNISTLRNYWHGNFDLQEGTLRSLQLYDISGLDKDTTGEWGDIKLLGVLGSLQMLTVDVDDLDTDEVVTRVVQASPQLQVLNISIQEGRALELVQSVLEIWHSRSDPLHMTLLERNNDGRGHIIAHAVIRGQVRSRTETNTTDLQESDTRPVSAQEWRLHIAEKVEFLQWNSDHVSTPRTDLTAAILKAAAEKHPSALTSFNMDVMNLCQEDLLLIQDVLQRSTLRRLHIHCTAFAPSLTSTLGQILLSVQWFKLHSLVLSGSAINEWIQLLEAISNESTTEGTVFYDLQLQQIEIHGSGVEQINLTHSSMLFIHRLVYTNWKIELVLANVSQEDKGDLNLIAESLRRFEE